MAREVQAVRLQAQRPAGCACDRGAERLWAMFNLALVTLIFMVAVRIPKPGLKLLRW